MVEPDEGLMMSCHIIIYTVCKFNYCLFWCYMGLQQLVQRVNMPLQCSALFSANNKMFEIMYKVMFTNEVISFELPYPEHHSPECNEM